MCLIVFLLSYKLSSNYNKFNLIGCYHVMLSKLEFILCFNIWLFGLKFMGIFELSFVFIFHSLFEVREKVINRFHEPPSLAP